jgi:hypothetical protein
MDIIEYYNDLESRKLCKAKLKNNDPCPILIRKNKGNYCSRHIEQYVEIDENKQFEIRERRRKANMNRTQKRKNDNAILIKNYSECRICLHCGIKFKIFFNSNNHESTKCIQCYLKYRQQYELKKKRRININSCFGY